MISANASRSVVKSVALFEAAKGIVVLLAGFGLLSLLHRDVRALAAALVGRLHLNPAAGFANSFIEAAARTTDGRLWFMALIGLLYALFRLLEAYGLWFGRVWAEWLAVLSGAIYVPIEIYEVAEKFTWIRLSALVVNLVVVCAMIAVLRRNQRDRKTMAAG
ncbi:MAG TPA: DUF2127 domain-containing protein [Opitutaceae bacterium]|nr:DUF2127 domain-containing protein [Opitutaceae bacterium]